MGKKLYVGNLPFSATEDILTNTFEQSGKVESVRIITDKMTGKSKGFGFVEMSTEQEASDAIAKFNGATYEGRPLTVSEAKPMTPRTPNGTGDRGGFNRERSGGGRFGGGGAGSSRRSRFD